MNTLMLYVSGRKNTLPAESFLDRLLSTLFPPVSLSKMRMDSTTLGYDYRMNRTGVEPVIDHTRVWSMEKGQDGIARWVASDSQPFISGARLGELFIGEAKPTYTRGTAASRAALRRGEI